MSPMSLFLNLAASRTGMSSEDNHFVKDNNFKKEFFTIQVLHRREIFDTALMYLFLQLTKSALSLAVSRDSPTRFL